MTINKPIIAYHTVFCAYGFWLPNDPRGSWSRYVRAENIFAVAGPATFCGQRRSVAGRPHDRGDRQRGVAALQYPPMVFSTEQIQAVGRGFAVACDESELIMPACAIMPNHVHIVTMRHTKSAEDVVTHLKSRASKQLARENLRPDQTIWAAKSWPVFLHDDVEIRRSIAYVNNNPIKSGMAAQHWEFVRPYSGG